MFEILLSFGDGDLNMVSLNCINCKKEAGLNSETRFNWVYDEVITQFVLNAMLHHVGVSWIISSKKEMDYDNFTNSNHLDWFDTGPWYNKNICYKLNGITYEYFITQARIDRYNIMCYLVAHDRLQDDYKDDESSIGDRAIPNDATVKALKSLGATFNFIHIWIHNFCEKYYARSESYSIAMKEMFKQIPQIVEKPLPPREKKIKNR